MESTTQLQASTIHEEINSYIDKLSFELKRFSKLLKFETDALKNRNYDELSQVSEEKTFLIDNIQRVDHALKAVFHDDHKETTLQDYIKSMPNGSDIKAKWLEQMQVLNKCNLQNSVNKKMVDKYINDIHSIIDIIDISNNPKTYNKNGLKVYSNNTSATYSNSI